MESEPQSRPTGAQSLDAAFTLLKDPRRRHLVSILADRVAPVSLSELAAAVAARESETDPDEVSAETVDAVAATLHHKHLPRLVDADLVTYDAESRTVTPEIEESDYSRLRAISATSSASSPSR